MNNESILNQFQLAQSSLDRAKLIIETGMCSGGNKEVVLYELIKSYKQMENLIREIEPQRFGGSYTSVYRVPDINEKELFLCTICGNPECQSDHK